ncbi:MAG: hypothetical protein IJ715_02610 [Bacilli bacterium]|nr:hypothetical protein [Bacilli bacterium]
MIKNKDLKKINILINGDELNRSEIIYNNVISNLNLTEEEQVKYLKDKATKLELEIKSRSLTILLCLISLVGIGFGIFLLMNDLYLIGSLFIVVTFVGVFIRFYLMYQNIINLTKSREFEKVDALKEILEARLR